MADMKLERCLHCGTDAVKGTRCPKSCVCKDCGAKPGSPCVRPSGHRAATMHAARWRLAEHIDWENGIRYEGQPRGATFMTVDELDHKLEGR